MTRTENHKRLGGYVNQVADLLVGERYINWMGIFSGPESSIQLFDND